MGAAAMNRKSLTQSSRALASALLLVLACLVLPELACAQASARQTSVPTASFSTNPNPAQPGQTLTVKAKINPGVTANGTTLILWFYNSAGAYIGSGTAANLNFVSSKVTPVTVTFSLPANLASGTYTFNASLYAAGWGSPGLWGEVKAGSFAVGSPSSGGDFIKWNPGHYAWLDVNFHPSRDMCGSRLCTSLVDKHMYVINSLASEPNVQGVKISIPWANLEGGIQGGTPGEYLTGAGVEGDYSNGFALIDTYLAALSKINKHLMFEIADRSFGCEGNSVGSLDGVIPEYAIGAGMGWAKTAADRQTAGLLCSTAVVWSDAEGHSPAMDRLIALSKAYAARYDNHPNVEYFGYGETVIGGHPDYVDQLKRLYAASNKVWKHTQLRLAANYAAGNKDMEDLINCSALGIGQTTDENYAPISCANPQAGVMVGGPDSIYIQNYRVWNKARTETAVATTGVSAQHVFRGIFSENPGNAYTGDIDVPSAGTDYRGLIPWVSESQGHIFDTVDCRYTSADLYQNQLSYMHLSYRIWLQFSWAKCATNIWGTDASGGMLTFINQKDSNGEYVNKTDTACPSLYEDRCDSN
jgi:hypothetical protein